MNEPNSRLLRNSGNDHTDWTFDRPMIAIYLHPRKDKTTGEDYLLEAPAVIEWWEREGYPGNAILATVEQLRPLLPEHGLDELRAQEDCHCVMVVRRG